MDQYKWCGIRFAGLPEPLTDCSRSGVSSLCGRLRVAAVVSDPMGGVHRHRSSLMGFYGSLNSLLLLVGQEVVTV